MGCFIVIDFQRLFRMSIRRDWD